MRYFCAVLLCIIWSNTAMATEVSVGGKAVYKVKIAKTEEEQSRGLMFVRSLPPDAGMLFDFSAYSSRQIAMWMKDTYIPLDMLFIDCDFKVVDIYAEAEPLSLKRIESSHDFCYVLEIAGGQSRLKEIQSGDDVIIRGWK